MGDPKNPIPIWWQKSNENTERDLNRFAVSDLGDKLSKALQQEYPAGLLEIGKKIETLEIGFSVIRTATKKQRKYRAELTKLFDDVQADIKALAESTGFDLLDESTWNQ